MRFRRIRHSQHSRIGRRRPMCRRRISRSRRRMRQCGSTRKLRRRIRCIRRIRSNWRNRTGQYGQRGFHNRRPNRHSRPSWYSRYSRYRCLRRSSLLSRRNSSRIRRNHQCRRSIRRIRSTTSRSRRNISTISTIPFTVRGIRASIRYRVRDMSNPRSRSIPPVRRLSPRQRRRRMPFSSLMSFNRELRSCRAYLRPERLRQCQPVQSQSARSCPVPLPCLPRRLCRLRPPCRLHRLHHLCLLRPSRRRLLSCSLCRSRPPSPSTHARPGVRGDAASSPVRWDSPSPMRA